jgi:hypothetical protein
MQSTTGKLVEHLASKGVPLDRIAAFVGELGSMIAEEPSLPIQEMERTMRVRGWEGFDIDERTYFLTLLVVVEILTEAGPEAGLWSDRPVILRIQLN